MAIDPVNWRREMKKFVGAELNALKDEISQLRTDFNMLTELVKILAANHMLANIENEIPKSNNAGTTPPKDDVGSEIKLLEDEISKLRADFNFLANFLKNSSIQPEVKAGSATSNYNVTKKHFTSIHSNGSISNATTTIQNRTGIHARPASVFVQTASKFRSEIWLSAKGKRVDAKSILMIMSMGLTKGTEVTITANGSDSRDAVKSLVNLIDDKFGEE